MGFAPLLELDTSHNLTPGQKDYVRYILTGEKHLLDLVNEILDLAGIESGKLHL